MAEEEPRRAAAKSKKKKTRGRPGDGSIYREKSGLWAVSISLPPVRWKPDGTPYRNRQTQRFRSRAEATAALRELREQKRQHGTLPGSSPTVEAWFAQWLKVYIAPHKKPRTTTSYRDSVRLYILPALGPNKRLNKLTPDDIRNIEALVTQRGLKGGTAKNAFAYASGALDAAVNEGLLFANPARRVASPRREKPDLDVFSLDDALKLFEALAWHPDRALWAAYLFTAARRGEIAGLEVDRITEVIDLSWQLQRLTYSHGCGDICGKKRGGNCPERHIEMPRDYEARQVQGGLYLTRPKSKAGRRIIPLVEPLRSILLEHIAGMQENEWGLLFARPHGRYGTIVPPDPDWVTHAWPEFRDEVFGPGRHVRLHDVRHSTVDLLYLAGVPEDVIVEIVGHSTRSMARQYKSNKDLTRLSAAMEKLSSLMVAPESQMMVMSETQAPNQSSSGSIPPSGSIQEVSRRP